MEFKCNNCNEIFISEGHKIERTDPVFGPTWRMMAKCPVCEVECDEHRKPKQSRSKSMSRPSPSCESCCQNGNCGI